MYIKLIKDDLHNVLNLNNLNYTQLFYSLFFQYFSFKKSIQKLNTPFCFKSTILICIKFEKILLRWKTKIILSVFKDIKYVNYLNVAKKNWEKAKCLWKKIEDLVWCLEIVANFLRVRAFRYWRENSTLKTKIFISRWSNYVHLEKKILILFRFPMLHCISETIPRYNVN